ncbi:MAG: alpha/beta hydrolase [Rhodothermales bacterium]|nr:alpha/beta hydrolase [Rhodothermales bacterium]
MSRNYTFLFVTAVLVGTTVFSGIAMHRAAAQTSGITGSWEGKLVIPQGTLRVVFHIAQSDSAYTATMDSPDQGAFGIPVSSVTVNGESVTIQVAVVGGSYGGTIINDSTMAGTWSQGPGNLPLRLVLQPDDANEPDNDSEGDPEASSSVDVPYDSRDVEFENPIDGITLAGTLTLPEGNGPYPAVILVSGSGAQDRDETIFGHKPFRVMADHLTREGIAVLRYDDRGVGESTGIFAEGTIELFANDAESAVAFLKGRTDIDPDRIGMLGHSEGGIIAPIVQQRSGGLSFMVLLAGPAIPGKNILLEQAQLILAANGATSEQVESNTDLQKQLFAILDTQAEGDELEGLLRQLLRQAASEMTEEERTSSGFTDANIELQLMTLTSPWFRHFVSYDPAPALASLECPVLALFGEKDLQVPSESNMSVISEIIAANESLTLDARVLPGLNHLFQTAESGSPSEYQQISESISPIALNEISSWIQSQL